MSVLVRHNDESGANDEAGKKTARRHAMISEFSASLQQFSLIALVHLVIEAEFKKKIFEKFPVVCGPFALPGRHQ